MTFNAYVTVYF